jgi:hypothetical protein
MAHGCSFEPAGTWDNRAIRPQPPGSEKTLLKGCDVKVYFDLCVYNRPFDDQTLPRVMIESLAVVAVMALINGKQIHSINSFVLAYENRKNPRPDNRSFIENLLAGSSEFIHPND